MGEEDLNLSAGSTIELMDEKGRSHEATAYSVIEHDLPYHMIITGDAYYEEVMGATDPLRLPLLDAQYTEKEYAATRGSATPPFPAAWRSPTATGATLRLTATEGL